MGPPLPDVTETAVDGTVSLYAPSTQQVLLLNETATSVWRLADGTRTVGQLVDELAAQYGVAAESIRDQVRGTVQDLADGGLIEPVD